MQDADELRIGEGVTLVVFLSRKDTVSFFVGQNNGRKGCMKHTWVFACRVLSTKSQEIDIELVGSKQSVKAARDHLKQLFGSVREQVFNHPDIDQQHKPACFPSRLADLSI